MTSIIKVDNIQDQDGNNIINENANTITIGASGDTVTLASGASQSGFGRTGTVDWDTTAKTASFTAVSGNGYFVNTTSGAITVTLPASPSAGDIVAMADYAGTSATNNIIIARNGSNIEGVAQNGIINNNRDSITLVYVDGTQGWLPVNDNESSFLAPQFVTATGGTVTTSGDFKIHTFTGPGTFCVSNAGNTGGSNTVDYLTVAGGGGGGGNGYAGGGGAGGYRESSGAASGCYAVSPLGSGVSALPVTAQGYPITVGGGGSGGPGPGGDGSSGANSVFSTITSAGGGGGGAENSGGNNGGSGGGGSYGNSGGNGNTPPVSPPQGQNGGTGAPAAPNFNTAGGGGAGGTGSNGTGSTSGDGGPGVSSSITASPVTRAGGGGGGTGDSDDIGSGGPGGGGNGGSTPSGTGSAGTANTGGGGGGGGRNDGAGGAGGSGVVIIRYKFQ